MTSADRVPPPPPPRGPWLALLAVLMAGWEPLSFALLASAALDRLTRYGWPAIALLACRVGITGLGIAAGRALWTLRPHGRAMALAWLGLAAAASVITFVTPYFPSQRPPGEKTLALLLSLAFDAGWAAYLLVSPRVRALFPRPG